MDKQDHKYAAAEKPARSRRRKKHTDQGVGMVLKLAALVAAVLVVFEGQIIRTLLFHRPGDAVTITNTNNAGSSAGVTSSSSGRASASNTGGTAASGSSTGGGSSQGDSSTAAQDSGALPDTGLAGFGFFDGLSLGSLSAGGSDDAEGSDTSGSNTQESGVEVVQSDGQVSEDIVSPAVLKEQDTPVDDSYYSNAVFIGDSRMQGFRNSSGITQGTFLTSVGLSTQQMGKQVISTQQGNISVYQGLSGIKYGKIYLMLGANDLGFWPIENFKDTFEPVIEQFHQLQKNAIIYICSVIYVDESKIPSSFDYDNNENVRALNKALLATCEDLDYAFYINLNEIFSNGYGSLISTASEDGIHLYPDYCVQMLEYLRTHYVAGASGSAADSMRDVTAESAAASTTGGSTASADTGGTSGSEAGNVTGDGESADSSSTGDAADSYSSAGMDASDASSAGDAAAEPIAVG